MAERAWFVVNRLVTDKKASNRLNDRAMKTDSYTDDGLPENVTNSQITMARIERLIQAGRASGETQHIFIANSELIAHTLHDPELRYLWNSANLIIAESLFRVVLPASIKKNVHIWVPMSNIFPWIARMASGCGFTLFLLGRDAGKTTQAVELLQEIMPELIVVGSFVSNWGNPLQLDTKSINTINAANPDIVIVDVGSPIQEKWIGIHGISLNVPVVIGFRGALDFILNRKLDLSLENKVLRKNVNASCSYRIREFDWTRHFLNGINFFSLLLLILLDRLRGGFAQASEIVPSTSSNQEQFSAISTRLRGVTWLIIKGPGYLDANAAPELERAGITALKNNPFLILDLSGTVVLTSSGVNVLNKLHTTANQCNGVFRIVNSSDDFLRVIRLSGVENILNVYPNITIATA